MLIKSNYFKYQILNLNNVYTPVNPAGDWKFEYSLKDNIYEFKVSGDMTFSNSKQLESKEEFTWMLDFLDAGYRFIDMRVQIWNETAYFTWENFYLDLLGKYDYDREKVTLKIVSKDYTKDLISNKNKKFDLLEALESTNVWSDSLEYRPCIRLTDAIQYVVENIANLKGIILDSSFLKDVISPLTSESSKSHMLYLCHKSTALDPNASNPATKIPITFNDIEKILLNKLNCFWYIKFEDNIYKFKVEHLKYYENGLSYHGSPWIGIDLTNYTYNGITYSDKFIRNKNKIEYEDEKLYRKETFRDVDSKNLPFIESEITYSIQKTIDLNKDYKLKNVSTDIEYFKDIDSGLIVDTDISNTGLFLFQTDNFRVSPIADLQIPNNIFKSFTNSETSPYVPYIVFNDEITEAKSLTSNEGVIYTNAISLKNGNEINVTFDYESLSDNILNPTFYFSLWIYDPYTAIKKQITEGSNFFSYTLTADQKIRFYIWSSTIDLSHFKITNFKIIIQTYKNVMNPYVSNIYCMDSYFKYGRALLQAVFLGLEKLFESTTYGIKGETIKDVPIDLLMFNPYKLVKTDIGNGKIKSIKINNIGNADIELIYQ